MLQTVWGYKDLRRTLEKDGWKKTDFMVNLNPPTNTTRTNGGYEDSTLPLIDRGQQGRIGEERASARPNIEILYFNLYRKPFFFSLSCYLKIEFIDLFIYSFCALAY